MQKVMLFINLLLLSFSAYCQNDYNYDGNGNLSRDTNKEISLIHYNHLNLVDTVTYTDGRKIIYTYTGDGHKLREQSIKANGVLNQKRDYVGSVNYRNDTLREIQNEDGRIVPDNPGNSSSTMEHQYFLKDHLGSVRTILTSKSNVDNNLATFETSKVPTEQNKFLRYSNARRINSVLFNHTKDNGTASYSVRLSGSPNEKYGMAKSLSVMPGDTIKLEVYVKYVDPTATNNMESLLAMVGQIASGTSSIGLVTDGAGYSSSTSSFPFTDLLNKGNGIEQGPKVYLNYLFFTDGFAFKKGGFQKMSTKGKETGSGTGTHEKLEMKFTVTEPGYVYAYLSNEESTPMEVYYDDFSVVQVQGPVIQQTDYDPFGLAFNEYQRENTVSNNFLYTGKEKQSDFDLNWIDYGARMYMADIGRWNGVDPKAEKYSNWSPYNYVLNNPIKFVDPDGMDVRITYDLDDGGPLPKTVITTFNGRLPGFGFGVPNNFFGKVYNAYEAIKHVTTNFFYGTLSSIKQSDDPFVGLVQYENLPINIEEAIRPGSDGIVVDKRESEPYITIYWNPNDRDNKTSIEQPMNLEPFQTHIVPITPNDALRRLSKLAAEAKKAYEDAKMKTNSDKTSAVQVTNTRSNQGNGSFFYNGIFDLGTAISGEYRFDGVNPPK
jgi:RHS repeat-associated protein